MPRGKHRERLRPEDRAFLKQLGIHCRRLREDRNYSIADVARDAEQLSSSVIQRLETGSGPVSLVSLKRYAEVLNLDAAALLKVAMARAEERSSKRRSSSHLVRVL